MTEYTVNIRGVEYDVDAPSQEEAVKAAHNFAQEELNTKAKAEYESASGISKPLMAAQDVARTVADTASLGYADKFADYMKPPIPGEPTQSQITKAIRSRMSGADVVADVGTTLAAAPTAVPKAVAYMGGGPVARGITGLLAGGAEGAAVGGASAAGHDQPVLEGAASGGAAGVGGQALAGMLVNPVNKAVNWLTGTNKALPAAVPGAVRGKDIPLRRVEAAAGNAEARGGSSRDIQDEFMKLQRKQAGFTPEEIVALNRVTSGDPATKLTERAASWLNDWRTLGGAYLTGGLPSATMVGAAGAASKFIGGQGRREAADDLRRLMRGKPKIAGPLADKEALALALRGRGYDFLNED